MAIATPSRTPLSAEPISNEAISKQLDAQITLNMKEFHKHSKTCSLCLNPVRSYQEGRDLCPIGRDLCVKITKVLYKKAEYVDRGVFEISYKQGWEAVDGLIKIIAHYNQGEFTTTITDLKRIPRISAPVAVPMLEAAPRGSGFEDDIRRRQKARRDSVSPSNNYLAVYGDPRTSFQNVVIGKPQGSPTFSRSSAESGRSVHFDSQVRVREFDA